MGKRQIHRKNDRKEILGWLTYDWANSTFYTTVVTVLAGPYLTALAQEDVGKNGTIFQFGNLGTITPESLVSFSLGISVFSQVLILPILGSIADYTRWKKRMMAFFCYFGVATSSLLFFITGSSYLFGCLFLMLANMCFAAANVFYNAFLVDLTTEDKRDKISSYGFAAGYVGGIIMLLLNLALIGYADSLGITKGFAVRLSMLFATVWWGVFGTVSFLLIKSRDAVKHIPKDANLVIIGFREIWQTLKELKKLRYTMLFLIAYLFYNDGIQTVILNSSVFLSQELFISRGLESDQSFLIGIFLVAQIFALIGALVFERISRVLGAKRTILVCLAIWCGIVCFAYGFLENAFQAWIMGAAIGLVLGSTQALSRSLYSQMIPVGRESSFFGLYEISEKGTSWMGQIVFGIVVATTGSFRQAILALIAFFLVGSVILILTNTVKAIHEAGNLTPEEAGSNKPD